MSAKHRRARGRDGHGAQGGAAGRAVERRLARASQAANAGDFATAERCYRDAVKADPRNPKLLEGHAWLLSRLGRNDDAIRALERAARLDPANAVVRSNLAILLHQRGDLDGAVSACREAIEANPGYHTARFNLAALYREAGLPEDAERELRTLIEQVPEDAGVWSVLAGVLLDLGRPDDARTCAERAHELDPSSADVLIQLGNCHVEMQRWGDAAEAFRRAVERAPELPEAHNNLAGALRWNGELGEALKEANEALRLRPGYVRALFNVGNIFGEMGRHERSLEMYQRAVVLEPENAHLRCSLATAYIAQGRAEDALASAQLALDRVPDLPMAHGIRGMALLDLGRLHEADEALEQALSLNADNAVLWFQATRTRRFGTEDAEAIARIETMLENGDYGDQELEFMHFALGKMCVDCGRDDDGFIHYREANALARKNRPFDRERAREFVDRALRVFDAEHFARVRDLGSASSRPIFIIGMPRSGTSLLEQILASHPAVAGAGELIAIPRLAENLPRMLGSGTAYPECVAEMDAQAIASAAEAYLDALAEVDASATRVTDKLPGNFQHLGLIATLFPNARVVHSRRDPRDTCLSNYFQRYQDGHRYSYDLGDLGVQYRGYERLMAHWHAVAPLSILDVDYEVLVDDLEAGVRRLLEFLDLPWDERCLRFYETERTVSTASHWQVRQRAYKGSVGRWRRYERHLGPLIEALGDCVPDADG